VAAGCDSVLESLSDTATGGDSIFESLGDVAAGGDSVLASVGNAPGDDRVIARRGVADCEPACAFCIDGILTDEPNIASTGAESRDLCSVASLAIPNLQDDSLELTSSLVRTHHHRPRTFAALLPERRIAAFDFLKFVKILGMKRMDRL